MSVPNNPPIYLRTGYEIDTNHPEWTDELTNALIGECFVGAEGFIAEGAGWDDRMRFLVVELARVCDEYGLSPLAWFRKVMVHLDDLLNQTGLIEED